MAEREGFEPSMEFLTPYSLSRGAPSTSSAISPLRLSDDLSIPGGFPCVKGHLTRFCRFFRPLPKNAQLFFFFNPLVNFFTVHRHFFRGIDANTHLIPLNA